MQLQFCEETVSAVSISTKIEDVRHVKQTVRISFISGKVFKKTAVHPVNFLTWYETLSIGDVVKAYYTYNHINKIVRL